MFVPGLVRRLLEIPCFEGCELRLMDIDAKRVRVMEALAGGLAAAGGRRLGVWSTSDRKEAITGADFVIATVSVGGMQAWSQDIEVPAKYGVFMHIADSIGPGGIFRALRNAPVVAEVASEAAQLAPRAFVLNYTNPASVNAMVMAGTNKRALSLCSCSPLPFNRSWLAELIGVDRDEIVIPLRVGGINHCTGIFSLNLRDGTNAIPLVRARSPLEVVRWAIDTFGAVPYCWEHWTEFFPQLQRLEEPYQGRAQGLRMRYGRAIYDMETQQTRVSAWEDIASEWAANTGTHGLDELPHGPEDEGILVTEVMESIVEDKPRHFIVNVPNDGLIPNLPPEAAVEVPAVVNGEGVHPIPIGRLPDALAGVLGQHAMVQALTARAALSGDRIILRQAMTTDPLLAATLDPQELESLTEELLEINKDYLPSFY